MRLAKEPGSSPGTRPTKPVPTLMGVEPSFPPKTRSVGRKRPQEQMDRAPRRAVDSALGATERRRAKEKGVTRALQHEVSALQGEVKQLHAVLAQLLGVNSRGIKDVFGKEFAVPVDEEHKATKLRIFNFTNPHGRAFHTSCFAGRQKLPLRHVCSRCARSTPELAAPCRLVAVRWCEAAVVCGPCLLLCCAGTHALRPPYAHTGYAYHLPACCTHQRYRAACPRDASDGTVRVLLYVRGTLPAGVPNVPRTVAPQVVWLLCAVLYDVRLGAADERDSEAIVARPEHHGHRPRRHLRRAPTPSNPTPTPTPNLNPTPNPSPSPSTSPSPNPNQVSTNIISRIVTGCVDM